MSIAHGHRLRQLDLFLDTVPARPYCSDNLDYGTYVRGKIQAITHRYIQANGPTHMYVVPFDVDRPTAQIDWQDRRVPPPNIVVGNPSNGHAHLLYLLAVPVRKAPDAQLKPLRYAAAVERAIGIGLDSDINYSGLIIKNPVHPDWDVTCYQENLYSLGWMADYVDLNKVDHRRRPDSYGLGRNVIVFDSLRHWAYKNRFTHDWASYDIWKAACTERACTYNAKFEAPLYAPEIKAIVKSVSRWVWTEYTGKMSDEAFSRLQAGRGRRGGRRSGQVRAAKAADKAQLLLSFEGLPSSTIATMTGIPAGTVRRIRAKLRQAQQ